MLKLNRDKTRRLIGCVTPVFSGLLAFTFLTIPRFPYQLDDALSWNAVLDLAHQRSWQFGDDLLFTYGPLGFLLSRYYWPGTEALRLAFDLAFCFSTAAAVTYLARRLGPAKGTALLLVFLFSSANLDPRADLLLYTGLLAWALLCLIDPGRARPLWGALFLATAIIASLAKVSFLIAAIPTLLFLAAVLLLRGQTRFALGLLLGFPAGLIAVWILLGQHIAHLGRFLAATWVFSKDYDAAMALQQFPSLLVQGVTLVLCTLAALWLRAWPSFSEPGWRRKLAALLVPFWSTVYIVLVAKYGLTRADLYHQGVLFSFVPIAAMAVLVLPCECPLLARASAAFAIASCCMALFTLQQWFVTSFDAFLLQPFRAACLNVRDTFIPGRIHRAMQAELEQTRVKTALPRCRERVGAGGVDVFGHDQSFAVLNEFNYRPRPVFQSYLAYSRPLMQWNEQWFYSEPSQFVLFNLAPIDRRFPPLEDSWFLRDLLINSEPVLQEDRFLLLKIRKPQAPKLALRKEGIVHGNEKLNLEELGPINLWLELDLQPTLRGQLRRQLYKPPVVRLQVWLESMTRAESRYVAPPPMLAAGFVASPLLIRKEDVLQLLQGGEVTRPRAYSLDLGADSGYWRENIPYRVYEILNPIGPSPQKQSTAPFK